MELKSILPPLYRAFLPDELLNTKVDFLLPDCNICEAIGDQNKKCCTYQPRVPNFQVARSFFEADNSPFPELLSQRKLVLPIASCPSPQFRKHFGKQVCPFFKNQKCGIWHFREMECATHFCNFEVPSAVKQQIFHYEQALMQNLLIDCGYEVSEVEFQLNLYNSPEDFQKDIVEDVLSEKLWKKVWSHYASRETEFFSRLYQLIQEPRVLAEVKFTAQSSKI